MCLMKSFDEACSKKFGGRWDCVEIDSIHVQNSFQEEVYEAQMLSMYYLYLNRRGYNSLTQCLNMR